MTKIVSNDSVEDIRSQTTAVAVPSGMTWGDVMTYGNAYLLNPGCVYHNSADRRAGYRTLDITDDRLYERSDFCNLISHISGPIIFAVAAIIVAPNSFLPVWPLVVIAGAITGYVVQPLISNNGVHFLAGAVEDVRTLFGKTKQMTLGNSNLRKRIEDFKRTPVKRTLRLEK